MAENPEVLVLKFEGGMSLELSSTKKDVEELSKIARSFLANHKENAKATYVK